MNLTLRRPRAPIHLRGVMPSSGVAPAGAATTAGAYTLRASTSRLTTTGPSIPYVAGYGLTTLATDVRTDVSRMGALFNQAAQQLGIPATADTSVAPTFLKDNTGTFFWTLPILASGPATDDALKRAMARAIFWSSTFSRPDPILGRTLEIDKQSSDGGASIVSAINASGAFSVTSRAGGVAPGSVPGSTTPPPGPVGGDSIVPIGGPGQMSVADLLSSFCQKRPKDSEAALTPRDRQEFQAALTRMGFSTQGIDGVIGNNTRTAVQAFQRAQGITSQGQAGYGTIGPQTQAAIIRAACQAVGVPQPSTPTPTTPAPTMPLPQTATPTTPAPATPSPTRPATPSTAQPLANTQPPAEAGLGAGPMVLLAAAGAAAVFLLTKKSKGSKGARS